jgi:hypothetical protein
MSQLALGLDMPSEEELAQRAKLAGLPDGDDALIEAVRKMLLDHHAAAMAADRDRMLAINDQVNAAAEKLNRGTRFGIATGEGAYAKLRRALAAVDGQEPMWGQPGRFIVTACGCRCVVTYDGLFGWTFSVRAVDFGRPFISETGFRSLKGWSCDARTGESIAQRVIREIEAAMSRDMNGKPCKPKLVKLGWFIWKGDQKIPQHVGPNLEDPAWQPGGWLHEAAKNPPPLALEA